MQPTRPHLTGNLFLDSLPPESTGRLLAELEQVDRPVGTLIAHACTPMEYVCFPITGVISAVTRMRDGSEIEVMLIGREGFYGVQLALGSSVSGNEATVQMSSTMLRMKSSTFVTCLSADPYLGRRALSYIHVIFENVSQLAGCNRLHLLNERFARWLLMAHDRASGDALDLTQEFLATMLGVRRPGVSVAAAALEAAGLIEYHRGRIVIKDRLGLEQAACECYQLTNEVSERVLQYRIRKDVASSEPIVPVGPPSG